MELFLEIFQVRLKTKVLTALNEMSKHENYENMLKAKLVLHKNIRETAKLYIDFNNIAILKSFFNTPFKY